MEYGGGWRRREETGIEVWVGVQTYSSGFANIRFQELRESLSVSLSHRVLSLSIACFFLW